MWTKIYKPIFGCHKMYLKELYAVMFVMTIHLRIMFLCYWQESEYLFKLIPHSLLLNHIAVCQFCFICHLSVYWEFCFGGVRGFCCPCSGTVYRCWELDMATTRTTTFILQLSFYFWAKSNWRYQWTKTHIMPNLSLMFCLSLPKLFFYQPYIYYTL